MIDPDYVCHYCSAGLLFVRRCKRFCLKQEGKMTRYSILIISVIALLVAGCGSAPALPDPGNLTEYRDNAGETFRFQVTGNADQSVWGTDVYTDDSSLAAAAVHAGVLEDGEDGVVTVTILPGEDSYTGSDRNGVISMDYGSWAGSYKVE